MRDLAHQEELVAAVYADAAAGRLVGLMERCNVLNSLGARAVALEAICQVEGSQVPADCLNGAKTAMTGARQFVNDALMAYYNR
jgi:hypothetical protein